QAEDGIRDGHVTGVQTCALPIWCRTVVAGLSLALGATAGSLNADQTTGSASLQLLEGYGRAEFALVPRGTVSPVLSLGAGAYRRSEERRVGEEWRDRRWTCSEKQ